MTKYLDEEGLKHYTEKIKDFVGGAKLEIGEEEGKAYDGAKGKANADFIKEVQQKPGTATVKKVVTPTLTGAWKVYNVQNVLQNDLSGSQNTLELEEGYQASFSGSWKWTHNDNNQDPLSTSGSFGTTLPASGVAVNYPTPDVKFTTDSPNISQTVTGTPSEKKEWTLNGGYLHTTSSSTANTASTSTYKVKFHNKRYFGATTESNITEAVLKSLQSDTMGCDSGSGFKSKTFSNLNQTGDVRLVFAYPAKAGDVSTITYKLGTVSAGVKDGFIKTTVDVTNAAGKKITYNVYTQEKVNAYIDNCSVTFA